MGVEPQLGAGHVPFLWRIPGVTGRTGHPPPIWGGSVHPEPRTGGFPGQVRGGQLNVQQANKEPEKGGTQRRLRAKLELKYMYKPDTVKEQPSLSSQEPCATVRSLIQVPQQPCGADTAVLPFYRWETEAERLTNCPESHDHEGVGSRPTFHNTPDFKL